MMIYALPFLMELLEEQAGFIRPRVVYPLASRFHGFIWVSLPIYAA